MTENVLVASEVNEMCRVDVRQRLPEGGMDLSEDALGWREVADKISVKPGEIHLWRGWLDRAESRVEECHSWLSDDERERAGRFHFERDRVRYISARGGLRHILGRYLGIKPCKIAFRYAVAGKPALALSHHSAVRFNVSHSEGLVLYAFSVEQDVGVDVERVRLVEEAGAILARHFSAETLGRWRTLAAEERPAAFLRIWVEAEAGAKQTGRGIAELGEHHRTVGGDRVRGFVPAPGYVGALAWEGPQHDQ